MHVGKLIEAFKVIKGDGAFSTYSGLDLLGVAGPVCYAESLCNLQPALKGWSDGDALACSPMPKSSSFLLKEKKSTINDVMIVYLFCGRMGRYL